MSGVNLYFMITCFLYFSPAAYLPPCYFFIYLPGEMLPMRTDARRHMCLLASVRTGNICATQAASDMQAGKLMHPRCQRWYVQSPGCGSVRACVTLTGVVHPAGLQPSSLGASPRGNRAWDAVRAATGVLGWSTGCGAAAVVKLLPRLPMRGMATEVQPQQAPKARAAQHQHGCPLYVYYKEDTRGTASLIKRCETLVLFHGPMLPNSSTERTDTAPTHTTRRHQLFARSPHLPTAPTSL